MGLLKFEQFKANRDMILEAKKQDSINNDFEKVYEDKLKEFGVNSPTQLSSNDLGKFLDSLKEYRVPSAYDMQDKVKQLRKDQSKAIRQIIAKSKGLEKALDAVKTYLGSKKVQYEAVKADTQTGVISVYLQGTEYQFKPTKVKEGVEVELHEDEVSLTIIESETGKEAPEAKSDLNDAEKSDDVKLLNALVKDLQDKGVDTKDIIKSYKAGEIKKEDALAKLQELACGASIGVSES